MIDLNTSADGKPKDYIVKVVKTYYVHTCDEDPEDAIKEMFDDRTILGFPEDEIDLEMIDVTEDEEDDTDVN